MRGLQRLVQDIHNRSLWQVAAIYLGGSWVALEVVDLLTETAGLPTWLPPFALSLLIIGFPVVMATAVVGSRDPDDPVREDVLPRPPVDVSMPAQSTNPESLEPSWRRGFARRALLLGTAVAALAWGVLTGVGAMLSDAPEAQAASGSTRELPSVDAGRPSIAVLPFANRSPNPDHAFFADGVHENILVALSRVAALDVTPRRSVSPYRDRDLPLADIANELHVGAVLEGSVHRDGERIRIIAQLLDPNTGDALWSETYDRHLDDIFAVQTEVARRVATALESTLTPVDLERLEAAPTSSVSAYDLYLRGRASYQRFNAESNDEAVRLYRLAIDRDPEFAAAWAGIGDAYLQSIQYYGLPRTLADSGRAMAEHALALDPTLAAAHKTIAFSHSMAHHHAMGLEANLKAIELDPSFGDAINNAGFENYYLGDLPKALHWVQRAVRLMPNDVLVRSNVGAIRLVNGDIEGGLERIDEALSLDPRNPGARDWRVRLELYRDDPEAALDLAEAFLEQEPIVAHDWGRAAAAAAWADRPERALAYAEKGMAGAPGSTLIEHYDVALVRGGALVRLGRLEVGGAFLERVLEQRTALLAGGADGWQDPWAMAVAAAELDRPDALDLLDSAIDGGFGFYPMMEYTPAFDRYRNHPRFQAQLGRVRDRVARFRQEITAEAATRALDR